MINYLHAVSIGAIAGILAYLSMSDTERTRAYEAGRATGHMEAGYTPMEARYLTERLERDAF